ncbi:MAG: exopolyphosphatase [Moraxella sp.]|nr:exopolyphosphatase [Moraxella sp.]
MDKKNKPTKTNHPVEDEILAAIDLGSNSFHLAIARVHNGELRKTAIMSEKIQLALGLDRQGRLSEDMQAKALACLSRFVGRLREVPADRVRVVGTNTLRQAINAAEFTAKANAILPRPIEIISGREEARLIYLGVAQEEPSDKRRLVIDIGGGSTELIIGECLEPLLTESVQAGCVSFTQRYFADGVIDEIAFDAAMKATQKELAPIVTRYHKKGWETAIGSSGTIKTVHATLSAQGLTDVKNRITLAGVQTLQQALMAAERSDKIALPAVKEHRKSVLAAGVAILLAVMKTLDIKYINYSDNTLKEGVMYDMLGRIAREDVRDDSVQCLLESFRVDKKQAKRVQKTAKQLFVSANQVLELQAEDLDRLRWAAGLHEIGMSIGHSAYHRHSAYILENAEIAGFSQAEQDLLGRMVAHHRRSLKPLTAIKQSAYGVKLMYLTLLLRLAVLVNRERHDKGHELTLMIVQADYWQIVPADDVSEIVLIELHDETVQFEKWGVRLEIVGSELA